MASRRVLLIHAIAFILIFLVWLAGVAIKTEAGKPLVALYYVLHIFPASILFIFATVEWQTISQQSPSVTRLASRNWGYINQVLHRVYYLMLMLLPFSGIAVFFDFLASRPFYQIHRLLFYVLLFLMAVNLVHSGLIKIKTCCTHRGL